jgi:dUTP pyrophosphatase
MSLKVTKLIPHAIIPSRATNGAAGYDLYSADGYVLLPQHRVIVSTGIQVALPEGVYGRVAARSGLAVKHGLDVGAGVIDPDYTGELKVVLFNHDPKQTFVIRPGYRIAQLILERYETVDVEEVEGDMGVYTDRGVNGFGSTGQ